SRPVLDVAEHLEPARGEQRFPNVSAGADGDELSRLLWDLPAFHQPACKFVVARSVQMNKLEPCLKSLRERFKRQIACADNSIVRRKIIEISKHQILRHLRDQIGFLDVLDLPAAK